MFSNFQRTATLVLLVGSASTVLAAPAPVSDISSTNTSNAVTATTSNTTSSPSTTTRRVSNETDTQRLERLLQNSNRVQLQLQKQIDDMSLEMSELNGQLEKNTYDMNQMLQRQRELFIELDRLRQEFKSSPAKTEPSADVSNPSEQQNSGTYSTNADEQTAYQNAVDLILKQKDYTGAITAFESFQTQYPDSVYASNAHYWLGQLYFAKKQDKDAAKSFAAVISYKDSNKRADALVKLGDIAKRNNNAEQANKYYQQVIEEYPSSASANAASTKLAQ